MPDLREIIRQTIERNGPMPFAKFMDLALYSPEGGYYNEQREIGKQGDFYTSVSVGPVFGELLAWQFIEWLKTVANSSSKSEKLQIVETGAHDGKLAFDILNALREQDLDTFERLEYWILEPSQKREAWQRERLSSFETKVRWFQSIETVPHLINGVIFSNELLDAFPVRRIAWDATKQNWSESCVSCDEKNFFWTTNEATVTNADVDLPSEILPHLPDEFIFELHDAAKEWWTTASAKLNRGYLAAIDYGYLIEDFLRSGKMQGTLRGYRSHRFSDNLLADPGEQDITADVNFSAIKLAGEKAGLTTNAIISQSKFLTEIFQQSLQSPALASRWNPQRVRQFQTLTHPEFLGRSFKVLIQSKIRSHP